MLPDSDAAAVQLQPTRPATDIPTHQEADDPPTNNGGSNNNEGILPPHRPPNKFAEFRHKCLRKLNSAELFLYNSLWNFVVWLASFAVSTVFNLVATYLCWLIYFRPYKLHPQVDLAVLVSFDLVAPSSPAPAGNGNTLLYDLTLNMTFVNKHSKCAIHFDHLTTGLYYNGAKIGPSDDMLPRFKLKRREHRKVHSVLRGQASNVSAALAEEFARERARGQFNINTWVKTTLTYRFFPHRITYYHEYDCRLQFPPVPGDGTPAVIGGGFKCGVAKQ